MGFLGSFDGKARDLAKTGLLKYLEDAYCCGVANTFITVCWVPDMCPPLHFLSFLGKMEVWKRPTATGR